MLVLKFSVFPYFPAAKGDAMDHRRSAGLRISGWRVVAILFCFLTAEGLAEPLPLKRAVSLALSHGTLVGSAEADAQRAFAAYRESRNSYVPQLIFGSGLGKSW